MKQFFQKFGWLVCLLLSLVLAVSILAQFFNFIVVLVVLMVFTMLVGLVVVAFKFRRHFVNLCLICILLVTMTSLVYNTGVFNGYIDILIKNVEVKEDVKVDGNVVVEEDVNVKGDAIIDGNVQVKENVTVDGTVEVKEDVIVDGGVQVKEDVVVEGNVEVKKDVKVGGDVVVDGSVEVKEDVKVGGDVIVDGSVEVKEDVNVRGDVNVDGDVNIGGDVNVDGKINEGTGNKDKPKEDTKKDDGGKGGSDPVDTTVYVTGISVIPETATLNVGDAKSLTATVSPSNATNKKVTWSSNDNSVATVTENGTVIAKSVGTVVITAKTAQGGYTDSSVITVKTNTVDVTGIYVSPSSATMEIGDSKTLTATVTPSNATNKEVTWSSSDNSVATVTSNGTVIARSAGTTVITAKTVQGGYTASSVITVKSNQVGVTGVTINPSTAKMKVGDTKTLTATVYPTSATNKNVTWSSNDNSVATVTSNGTVIAKSAGIAVITVRTNEGGYTDTCVVTVEKDQVVAPNATAKITFGDHIDGATDIFASVVISEGGKTPKINSNLSFEVVKVNDTVYHVKMTITEGSHGVAAISVSGDGITYNEVSMNY